MWWCCCRWRQLLDTNRHVGVCMAAALQWQLRATTRPHADTLVANQGHIARMLGGEEQPL